MEDRRILDLKRMRRDVVVRKDPKVVQFEFWVLCQKQRAVTIQQNSEHRLCVREHALEHLKTKDNGGKGF